MASSDLEDLCFHINTKISTIKKTLQLRNIGQEPSLKSMLSKIGQEMVLLHDLLNKMETEVQQQEKLKALLKELQKSAEREQSEAQHLRENIPPHLPKPTQSRKDGDLYSSSLRDGLELSITGLTGKCEEQGKAGEPERAKKPTKEQRPIKEVALITAEEFESVPAYMKGRLTYDQINAVVQEMNKAVVGKYKILHQPLKSMSAPVRNLYHRFIEEETKDTKGGFFIVEADIKEFTQLKADKRFHSILNILRHCQRVREVRGSRLVRYVIC
ncbi:spindle and kinetochore-associated protein 1 isoform X1 [Apus apus]|uniref:spindle and kinetochore-associated protein 1 isoform X1 n=1 Tax=Apus apus TaxID=8895 RepID=UPI0021F870A3|nr:spindle and kinetochore-associated protein 1 isoform X1 [Apus apus]XP_051498491.1 spindle and kinetochore-associated protein 1 isoform X1 [Apus apus]